MCIGSESQAPVPFIESAFLETNIRRLESHFQKIGFHLGEDENEPSFIEGSELMLRLFDCYSLLANNIGWDVVLLQLPMTPWIN
jgi:hypothetical protein